MLGRPAIHSNDWVDNRLLAAVRASCVDFLVTSDSGIFQKARRLGIESKLHSPADAVQMLQLLAGQAPKPPPAVQHKLCHNLNADDPIFNSFRQDYPGFDTWLEKCRKSHPDAWVIMGSQDDYAGICIVKDETTECSADRLLKICSLKVADDYAGFRFGELLLKTVFVYARKNEFQQLFVTVFEKYAPLVLLLESFGFIRKDELTPLGELILEKTLLADDRIQDDGLADIDYNIFYGPFVVAWARNRAFFVPIRPEYHAKLFPEAESQLALFSSKAAYGNSIKKAYLCNASTRQMKRGDLLLFYRSNDVKGITALGVLEDSLISSNPAEITAFVGNRTVYSQQEIKCLARSGVLALLFRHARNLRSPLSLAEIIKAKALRSAPQSIQQVGNGGFEWIRDHLMVR